MKTKLLTPLIALPLMLGSVSAFAVENIACQNLDMRSIFRELALTDEQKAQFKDIRRQNRQFHIDQFRENKKQKDETRKAILNVIFADSYDEVTARELAEKRSTLQIERRIDQGRRYNEMYQLLSTEQQIILKENIDLYTSENCKKMRRKSKKG